MRIIGNIGGAMGCRRDLGKLRYLMYEQGHLLMSGRPEIYDREMVNPRGGIGSLGGAEKRRACLFEKKKGD